MESNETSEIKEKNRMSEYVAFRRKLTEKPALDGCGSNKIFDI